MKLTFPLLCIALAITDLAVGAQSPVPNGLLTAATTTTDASGQKWVYLRWQSTDGELPFGTPFAVYMKNGAADSTAPLVSQGIAMAADKTAIASVQLSRSTALGADPAEVAETINTYYDVIRNSHLITDLNAPLADDGTGLAEKLARLIQQARGDARSVESLRQIALSHPAMALAIGEAWAGRVSVPSGSPVTIELRSWDPVTSTETGIAGRVTVNVGTPEIILAPGAPVQVPDSTATGDRVVKLRFSTGEALRRQTPIMSGFSLHRVTRAAAEARGWHMNPPPITALRALETSNPTSAANLTHGPLLIGKLFDATSVANFDMAPPGDPITHYFADDNHRYARDANGNIIGTPFPDGAQFYYFAAGRDLLGRDGLLSFGGPGTAIARLAPPVPMEVTLTAEPFEVESQIRHGFRLRWKANLPDGDNGTDFYEIFRGSQADTPGVDLADPTTLPQPTIVLPQAPAGDGYMSWLDTTIANNVATPTSTWWYTIRAVHHSPAPPDNRSGLAPALYGSIHADSAPEPPVAIPSYACPLAGLAIDATQSLGNYELVQLASDDPTNPARRRVRLVIATPDGGIDAVGFKWSWVDSANASYEEGDFTDFEIIRDATETVINFEIPAVPSANGTPSISFTARAKSIAGATSREVSRSFTVADVVSAVGSWPADQAMVIHGTALAPGLTELRRSIALHTAMFGLGNPVSINGGGGATSAGGKYFTGGVYFSDHTAVVVEAQRNGLWTTFTGVEAMGNRISFLDPLAPGTDGGSQADGYRAFLVETGSSPRIHFADGAHGDIPPVSLLLQLPANFGEYRIYRRVDDGNLELLAQGDGSKLPPSATVVQRDDNTLPATACRLAYFGQTFDKQGVASALVPLGETITIGRARVETPVLKIPRPLGTADEAFVRLEWYCPPEGIERFVVNMTPLGLVPGGATAAIPSGGPISSNPFQKGATVSNTTTSAAYSVKALPAFTPAINRDLGEGPVFVYTNQRVVKDTKYKISVQAISVAGIPSPPSREFEFAWRTPTAPAAAPDEPKVAWPSRPLPPVGHWHPYVKAELTSRIYGAQSTKLLSPGSEEEYPVGVRIGSFGQSVVHSTPVEDPSGSGHFVCPVQYGSIMGSRGSNPINYLFPRGDWKSSVDPVLAASYPLWRSEYEHLLQESIGSRLKSLGEMLLPAVLYRQQVPSVKWPNVSGGTIQVSPMIEKIAYNTVTPAGGFPTTIVRDPYIGLHYRTDFRGYGSWIDLFLLDTQPVIKGAKYRYTLLRFDAGTGEIAESIDAGELLIPEDL